MAEMERPHGLPGPRQARRIEDFNALYAAGTPAWDIGRPQPAFRELAEHAAALVVGALVVAGAQCGRKHFGHSRAA